MSEECENDSFDFPFPEDGGCMRSGGENAVQDPSRENEEESSGASDYPEGISGFTPPKDYRIHKLYKAKVDRKTTKKGTHKSHNVTKCNKKEQRTGKSKSMIELPLSPDIDVKSHQKQRHASIAACTITRSTTSENPIVSECHKEETSVPHQPPSSPAINKLENEKETLPKDTQLQVPLQSSSRSSSPIARKDSPINPWQRHPFYRRSSVDANSGVMSSIVSRATSSPTTSLRLFESLHEHGMKPRASLNLLSVQDDHLDYAFRSRMMKSQSFSQHRHVSSFIPDCPRERNEFYSHLHMTVLHLGIANAVARRQNDTEESQLTKDGIHQSISMQLRAYLQTRSVKIVSDDLAMKKLDVDRAIDDILSFYLPIGDEVSKELFRHFSVRDRSLYTEISGDSNDGDENNKPLETISEEDNHLETHSTESILSKDESTKFQDDQFMTSAQALAMERVKEVLNGLDEAESLYHNFAEMGDENPKYRSLEFVRRVEALHLWVRITEMLASRLCLMSQLCGIRVDLEPGENDVCLQSLNSSRITWNALKTEQTRTDCCKNKYRDFVDNYLKKFDVQKMMRMIKKSMAAALHMARCIFIIITMYQIISLYIIIYSIDMRILERGMQTFTSHTEHITIEVLQMKMRWSHC